MSTLIGKGAFTKCYLINARTVCLYSSCPIKECMAMGMFPSSKYFPKLQRVRAEEYTMRYYNKVRSLKAELKPAQWKIYQQLRAVYNSGSNAYNMYDNYQQWRNAFSSLTGAIRGIMQEAIDACANYGTDISFEISPRNVAVHNGNLILLDCFYSVRKLQQVRGTSS